MQHATSGSVLLLSSVLGMASSLALTTKNRTLAVLTLSDAVCFAIVGSILVSRAVDYLPAPWDLAIFCASLAHAQYSSLNIATHVTGIQGFKLWTLMIVSWTVPILCCSIVPVQWCAYEPSIISNNRSTRVLDGLIPTWFEENYDFHELRNYTEDSTSLSVSPFSNSSITLPTTLTNNSMTFVTCEKVKIKLYLVSVTFIGYLLPILAISTIHISSTHSQGTTTLHIRSRDAQNVHPTPRPRSAPPFVTPRSIVSGHGAAVTSQVTSQRLGVVRLLVLTSALAFAPGMAVTLLDFEVTTKVYCTTTMAIHAVLRTAFNNRLVTTIQPSRVQPA